MTIDEQINELRNEIKRLVSRIIWLRKNRAKLEKVPAKASFVGTGRVDFDNLPHADVVKVIRAFGGKWKKEPAENGTVHYDTTLPDGTRMFCYSGAPPPSCKIIEVEVHVPEQIIPASVRKVRKMVCLPEVGAVIAVAAQKGINEHENHQTP